MKRHLKVVAEVRKNEENRCPFGLPIPFGCKYAGEHITKMAPFEVMGKEVSEEETQALASANTKLLAWNLLRGSEKPSPCKFAGHVLEKNNAVECNYDDTAPGQGPAQPLLPAPYYSKMFNGIITGLTTYPAGYMSDFNFSRNLYFGTYSLQGARIEWLHKLAQEILGIAEYTNNSE